MTYGRIVVDYRPPKYDSNKVRLAVVGNFIKYLGDVLLPTADIHTEKLLFNSVIFTPGSKYMCCKIKNFYMGMPMAIYEYIKYPLALYQVMYGLTQKGIIANELLTQHLAHQDYGSISGTP